MLKVWHPRGNDTKQRRIYNKLKNAWEPIGLGATKWELELYTILSTLTFLMNKGPKNLHTFILLSPLNYNASSMCTRAFKCWGDIELYTIDDQIHRIFTFLHSHLRADWLSDFTCYIFSAIKVQCHPWFLDCVHVLINYVLGVDFFDNGYQCIMGPSIGKAYRPIPHIMNGKVVSSQWLFATSLLLPHTPSSSDDHHIIGLFKATLRAPCRWDTTQTDYN